MKKHCGLESAKSVLTMVLFLSSHCMQWAWFDPLNAGLYSGLWAQIMNGGKRAHTSSSDIEKFDCIKTSVCEIRETKVFPD